MPSGCTSLVQPLDTAVNKAFKQYLREATDYLTNEADTTNWTLSDRRILTTHAVAEAWKQLCDNHGQELVKKSFKECGISINPDGSEDHLINIKDHHNILFDGWEVADDPIVKIEQMEEHEIPAADDEYWGFDINLPTDFYTRQRKDDLKSLYKARGLAVSSNKDMLINRLKAADNQQKSQAGCTKANAIIVHDSQPPSAATVDQIVNAGETKQGRAQEDTHVVSGFNSVYISPYTPEGFAARFGDTGISYCHTK